MPRIGILDNFIDEAGGLRVTNEVCDEERDEVYDEVRVLHFSLHLSPHLVAFLVGYASSTCFIDSFIAWNAAFKYTLP